MREEVNESAELKALIDVSIEGWRFVRAFNRLAERLELDEVPRYANQARYFLKKVDDGLKPFGVRIVTVEGQPYEPGMAVSALNLGDFSPEDALVVEQMIEPVVMGQEGLVRSGTVMLAKVERA
jgi:class 3 adenylate cyclase